MKNKKLIYSILFGISTLLITGSIVFHTEIKDAFKASLFYDGRLIALKESLLEKKYIFTDTTSSKIEKLDCDVLVVGGGAGGTAAAIQSARLGVNTCLVEETDWLGGMLSSAGVGAIDGMEENNSGIFKEFVERIQAYYKKQNRLDETTQCTVSYFCFEPSIGDIIFKEMVSELPQLRVFYNAQIDAVSKEKNTVTGIRFHTSDTKKYTISAHVTVDATEFGDVMYLADIPYDLGIDVGSKESLTKKADACIQPLTYVALIKDYKKNMVLEKPQNYNIANYQCLIKNEKCPDSTTLFDIERLFHYGMMPDGKVMINIPSHSYGNDFHATAAELEDFGRDEILEMAKEYSRGFIYFIQTELGYNTYGLVDEFGTADHFAKLPYVRESRRLQGIERLEEKDVLPRKNGRAPIQKNSIAIGDYPIDLHFCAQGIGDVYYMVKPYQIPYGVTVPKDIDGFLVAEKNISVSRIVNGTTRLQPVIMSVGQAVGVAASLATKYHIQPRDVEVEEIQKILIEAESKIFYFKDIDLSHFAYKHIAKYATKGVIKGYKDLTFKPSEEISKAAFAKLMTLVLDLPYTKTNTSTFEDVNIRDWFSVYAEALRQNGIISEEEKTFHPHDTITRLEMTTYLGRALHISYNIENSKNFTDITEYNDQYTHLEKLTALNIVTGYENGTFQPKKSTTRAEIITVLSRAKDLMSTQNDLISLQ